MSFSALYRLSFYTMLVVASLVMSVEVGDINYAMIFPAAVAVAGVVAFLTVDRSRQPLFDDATLNVMALLSLPLLALEYFSSALNILLLALGHWLIYLELNLMFRPKTIHEDWELFLLGLVQVMIGTMSSQSDSVGLMLITWAILALWVLGLFSLEREALRAVRADPRAPLDEKTSEELYPGLLNAPFLFSALRVTLTTLALGGVIFLAMPRRTNMNYLRAVESQTQHLTGFDDEVQLGQLGEILENDAVVMSIELFNEAGERLTLDGEPLWRGVTMARYDHGRWYRQRKSSGVFPNVEPESLRNPELARPPRVIRQLIKLESNDSPALFGLRPMLDAASPRRSGSDRRYGPTLNSIDGSISRNDTRSGLYDYEVTSLVDADIIQPGERRPDSYTRKFLLMSLPEDDRIQEQLKQIADRVIAANVAPGRRSDPRAVAVALESYLRDSGEFGYSLKLTVKDPSLDPVIDFLINRKEGHCEYFASALTLLLRSAGIPARMVNGFKGGDWNDLARIVSVRQKHAHSWVEAYLGDTRELDPSHPLEPAIASDTQLEDEPLPRWLTLDPTPGIERDRSVAMVGGFRENFRQITDLIRYVWVFYIVGYNSERQNRLIYQPIRFLVSEAKRGFGIMGDMLQKGYAQLLQLLRFESTGSLFSWRGLIVSFIGLLLLAGLVYAAVWLGRKTLRWLRGQDERSIALSAGAAHYRRLALLLAEYGLERPPAETQEEFAHRATQFLTARGSNTETIADVPRLVVDAFYRVRFGHLDLSPKMLQQLEARLDALEASLHASQA